MSPRSRRTGFRRDITTTAHRPGSRLKREDAEGRKDSALSVFTRDAAGTLRHFYTTHPWLDDDMNERGIDLLQPVYNMLDLTPPGRGNWYASLDYGTRVTIP